jgi:predicted MFS family arabinose efflux permease
MDKARLIRWTKAGEFLLMLGAAASLLSGSLVGMLAVLFGLGVQATFFGPLKYAILPQILPPGSLLSGNALVESGTFVAILLGSAGGGLLAGSANGAVLSSIACLLASAAGLAAARGIPPAPPQGERPPQAWNPLRGTRDLLRIVRQNKQVWRATLAISWFWTLGSVLLAQIPVLAAQVFQADGRVAGLLVGAFTLGIGAGSLLAPRLGRALGAVPWAGLGITLACADLAWAASARPVLPHPVALVTFLSGWRILADLLIAAGCGGLFSVPLYALVQARSAADRRARSIAAGNVVNAAGMAAGSALAALAAARGVGPIAIVLAAALVNLAVAVWARITLTDGEETEIIPRHG